MYLLFSENLKSQKDLDNREMERIEQQQTQQQQQQQQMQQQYDQHPHHPPATHYGLYQQQFQHGDPGIHREEMTVPLPMHVRPAGEGAEGPPVKKKPSALDRVALAEQEAMEAYAGYHGSSSSSPSPARSQSPSRRSPPCSSPSTWHKYRGSPPRSPPIRVMSPKSPTEKYPPDVYDNVDIPDDGNYFTYECPQNGGFVRPPDGPLVRGPDGQYVPDKPPPKPARMSDQYEFQVENPFCGLDLFFNLTVILCMCWIVYFILFIHFCITLPF